MRPRMFSIALAVFAFLLVPALRAQKFPEPSREELQMTADPKAPGAAAVYLYREQKTDNFNHYFSEYARIKVLTELGKEYATVEVPYIPGFHATPILEARTIHPDGSVIPLEGKAEDLLVRKTAHSHINARVFNMPSVEVGSILEYRWTIPMVGGKVSGMVDDEDEGYYGSALTGVLNLDWEVQAPLFIHKEHFYYEPFNDADSNVLGTTVTRWIDGERVSYLLHTEHLPAGVHAQRLPKGEFTLDIENVPAIPHESSGPPSSSFLYRVRFYWTSANSAQVYWDNQQKRWSRQLDSFASPSDGLRAAAQQIAGAAATPEAKARALYAAVQGLENTDFARAKSEAERRRLHLREVRKADDVWSQKSGSSNDLAALYLALARAAGLEAYGVKVADRDQRIFDANYLSVYQLDSLLVLLRIDGKDLYLDPGEKLCPFGQLHWTHSLAGGLAQNQPGPTYTPQNLTKDAITAHAAELTLDAAGTGVGTVKILMNGPSALNYRQLALTADAEEVKRQLNQSLHALLPQGVSGEVEKIQGLETGEGFLSVTVKVDGRFGSVTGKRILLPAFPFSTGPRPYFVAEEHRESPIDLHYAEQVIDDAIYHLPAGFAVESAPQPAQLPWPDHAALVVKIQPGAGQIEIKHVFARSFVLLDAKEYPALRDYYQKLATNDQQQLVLAAAN